MSTFPHIYHTKARGSKDSNLHLTAESLPSLEVAPPVQFGGPEGYWNPEAFFSASVSTCFILTFKAVSRAMKLDWRTLDVNVKAYLDKQDGKLSFTKVEIFPQLEICCEKDVDPFLKALKKSEESCLITNSIKAEVVLHPKIKVVLASSVPQHHLAENKHEDGVS
ncbi:MAG: OsmC family protein [Bacteriovoracaceae bacterium]|nr:OsmC family protein [Bacteriovoracaceae bacterium]